MRILLTEEPFNDPQPGWFARGRWPASWITHPNADGTDAIVTAYRRRFSVDAARTVLVHVSADERYELYLDGERVGRGPERGDVKNWYFESYDLTLPAGSHVLVARTWWLGDKAPFAQVSNRPGFLLAADAEHVDFLNTGHAEWNAKHLGGYGFEDCQLAWGVGAKLSISGTAFSWGFERGEGDGWITPRTLEPGHNKRYAYQVPPDWQLRMATLPPMMERVVQAGKARHVEPLNGLNDEDVLIDHNNNIGYEARAWDVLLGGGASVTIPPNTQRRVIIDLGNYYCAYPELTVTGGWDSTVRVRWAEALFESGSHAKGNRDVIEGKRFVGVGDTFHPDGGQGRHYTTLWWESGRYVEAAVITGDHPLTIESLAIRETHYPYEFTSRFASSEPRLAALDPIAKRVLEMCSHETYMDCPYYEQLMYIGDTRLEVLTTYALTGDDRLPRKALTLFDASRLNSGITQSRYPTREQQLIPPFSVWWVAMVHDYLFWRDDIAFVRTLMPGVRAVLEAYRGYLNSDGLVQEPRGWNFMDWVPGWDMGIPPDGFYVVSSVLNWQFAYVLTMAAEIERALGEQELAARNEQLATTIADRTATAFYDAKRGLIADDLAQAHWSEHAQCLALLTNRLPPSVSSKVFDSLLTASDLSRTSIYFTHYLFETLRKMRRMDVLFDRMGHWFKLAESGFKTTFEEPDPNTTRSDCHAWGAHPLFHYRATILGIRPAKPGFAHADIDPQLGALTSASGTLPHPRGEIAMDVKREDDKLSGHIVLPNGVAGTLRVNGEVREIGGGRSAF